MMMMIRWDTVRVSVEIEFSALFAPTDLLAVCVTLVQLIASSAGGAAPRRVPRAVAEMLLTSDRATKDRGTSESK